MLQGLPHHGFLPTTSKFVIKTSTVVSDPPDWLARAQAVHPSIIALARPIPAMLPGIYPPVIPGRAMISRHDAGR